MTLIKCSECGKKISDKAKECPNCGCPIDNRKLKMNDNNSSKNRLQNMFSKYIDSIRSKNKNTIIITCVVIVFIVLFIFLLATKDITLYKFSNNYNSYESITLERFGKCYTWSYYTSNGNIIDNLNDDCKYSKRGNTYTITLSGKEISCKRNGEKATCKSSTKTTTYDID